MSHLFFVKKRRRVDGLGLLKKKTEYIKGRHFYRFGKDEHIVRLHIGLEEPKELIADLNKALKFVK